MLKIIINIQENIKIKNELKALDKILNSKIGINFISNFKRIYNITKKSETLPNSLKIKKELFVFKEEMQLYNFLTKLSKIATVVNNNRIQSQENNKQSIKNKDTKEITNSSKNTETKNKEKFA